MNDLLLEVSATTVNGTGHSVKVRMQIGLLCGSPKPAFVLVLPGPVRPLYDPQHGPASSGPGKSGTPDAFIQNTLVAIIF